MVSSWHLRAGEGFCVVVIHVCHLGYALVLQLVVRRRANRVTKADIDRYVIAEEFECNNVCYCRSFITIRVKSSRTNATRRNQHAEDRTAWTLSADVRRPALRLTSESLGAVATESTPYRRAVIAPGVWIVCARRCPCGCELALEGPLCQRAGVAQRTDRTTQHHGYAGNVARDFPRQRHPGCRRCHQGPYYEVVQDEAFRSGI